METSPAPSDSSAPSNPPMSVGEREERRRADRELRESELRFRGLFEQTPVSMQRFRPDGVSLKVNRAYEKLFHLTDEQLEAAKFNLLQDRQISETGLLPIFKRAFAGEPVRTPPTPFIPNVAVAGGRAEARYIRGHFFPIRDSLGEIREIIAMHEDVTELMNAQLALKELNQELEAKIVERTRAFSESEQRLRAILETQTELVGRYTPAGITTYVNPAYERVYGVRALEYVGKNWIEQASPDLAAKVRAEIAELTPENPGFEFLHRKVAPDDGRVTHEHWVNRGIFDEAGKLVEIQAAGRDVTELMEAERRFQESEARFQRLFEDSPAGVVLLEGVTMVAVNPAGLKLIGLSTPKDAVGRSLLEFSPEFQPGGIPSVQAAAEMAKLRQTQGNSRFEWVCRNLAGAELTIEAFSSTVEIGGRTLAQVILHDISERKRAEQELRNSLERERELSQLKSNFISMVSHEYRNPLGIILSSTELLKRYHDRLTPAERMESILDIEVATRRMAGMIDNLLLMGKADAGKLALSTKLVDLVELSQVIINEAISAGSEDRKIRFEHRGIDSFATADEQLLRLILGNLLTNALKYSPPDRAPSLTLTRVGRHAVFAIHDDGIGIPEEDRPALFQAFRRARNVGLVNGTGLGLYIVKHCVDLHEGTIELESAVGKGTTVTINLPMFPALTELASSIGGQKGDAT
ncbi:MAG: PAS domain S-box protein [Nibricoccus sp.]